MRNLIIVVALLACSFVAQSASAQCSGGSCGIQSRPYLGAPARVVERSVLRVRHVASARPVRGIFRARPVRGLLFRGCLRGRCG